MNHIPSTLEVLHIPFVTLNHPVWEPLCYTINQLSNFLYIFCQFNWSFLAVIIVFRLKLAAIVFILGEPLYLIVLPQALMSWTISLCRNPSTGVSFTLAMVSPAPTQTHIQAQHASTTTVSTSIHWGFNYCKLQPSEACLILNETSTHVQRKRGRCVWSRGMWLVIKLQQLHVKRNYFCAKAIWSKCNLWLSIGWSVIFSMTSKWRN